MKNPGAFQVVHFGPDPSGIGGIETVLRAYRDLPMHRLDLIVFPTWFRGRAFRSASAVVRALYGMLLGRWNSVDAFHVHLSHRGSFVREGTIGLIGSALKPTYITIHGSEFIKSSVRRHWRAIYSLVLRRAAKIAVLDDAVRETVHEIAGPGRSVVVLENPGPVMRPELTIADHPKTAVFAGLVGRRKGVDTLISAWKGIEDELGSSARLDIFGPIVESADEQVDEDLLLPYWRGAKGPQEIEAALRASTVAVLPSRNEGMPMFLIEAMAFGKPLVVTNIGAMPFLAAGNGAVVEAGDAHALQHELRRYLTEDTLQAAHGMSAFRKYVDTYGIEVVETRLIDLYCGS